MVKSTTPVPVASTTELPEPKEGSVHPMLCSIADHFHVVGAVASVLAPLFTLFAMMAVYTKDVEANRLPFLNPMVVHGFIALFGALMLFTASKELWNFAKSPAVFFWVYGELGHLRPLLWLLLLFPLLLLAEEAIGLIALNPLRQEAREARLLFSSHAITFLAIGLFPVACFLSMEYCFWRRRA